MEKIFISYNHRDQDIVDKIANQLASTFNRENIFYDSWTIQPGESIIEKMNEGLSNYSVFFLFVSYNSLNSRMVSLEWQSALYRCVNENLKFVCVRIADCKMPPVLADRNYIDLFNEGIDGALHKMQAVVKNENVYIPSAPFKNISARIVRDQKEDNFYLITFSAKQYVEQNLTFGVGCRKSHNDFGLVNMGPLSTYGFDTLKFKNGETLPIRTVHPMQPIKPGFPYTVGLSLNEGVKISTNDIMLFVEINAETSEWELIEY